ncbi:MAG: DUF4097 family beta strand repeat-containing protein [Eubacteriales bacterium]|nr:DUF4097 family beta strand repeat-containing protein [Eubacteriales bacterium]
MKKWTKTLAIIAACLLGLGLIVCAGAIASAKDGVRSVWDSFMTPLYIDYDETTHRLHLRAPDPSAEPLAQDYTAQQDVRRLEIAVVTPDVLLVPSDTAASVSVHYTRYYDVPLTVAEDSGTLHISQDTTSGSIGFDFRSGTDTLTVEYPAGMQLDALSVDSTNGYVEIGALEAASVQLSGVNGETYIKDLRARDAVYTNVNGSFSGTLTCDTLTATSTNGHFELTLDAREADFTTVNADAELTLAGAPSEYEVTFHTVNGELDFDGMELSEGQYGFTAEGYPVLGTQNAARTLRIECTNGEFDVETLG